MSARPHDWSPLRGSDPVPGDPDEVERIGKRYADTARTLREQAARLRALAHDRGWHSTAADEWRHQAREVAEDLAKVESRYEKAGGALRTYSGVLRQAQTQADAALELARDAEHRARAADRATEEAHRRHASAPPETPAPDTTQLEEQSRRAGTDLATAQARLRAAEAARDAGAAAAERAIERITGSDGLDDGRWAGAGKWFGDKVEWVDRNLKEITEVAGRIAAAAGVAALLVSFIPVIGQVLAAVLTAIAVIASAVALIGSAILLVQGRGGWGDVAINVVGLLTFGTGRAALAGVQVANRGARAAAQSGLVDEALRGLAATRGGLSNLGGKTVRSLRNEARRVVKPTMPGGGLTRDQMLQGLAHPPRSFPRVGDVLQGMRPGPALREGRASLPELWPALKDSGERLVLGRAPGLHGQTLLSVTADAERALAGSLDDVARSMPHVRTYLSAGTVQLNLGRAMDGAGAVLEGASEAGVFDEFKRRTTAQPLL